MIDDLRHYRPSDAFQLLSEEVAEYAIAAFLFLCFVADRMGWF